jgi:transcriptional regulator with XRE-family HTH domain
MDFRLLIRQRLRELGTEQRDLAAAARVTESYISQLLRGKKAPPAPERTDIYNKMETFLRLPAGKLATMAHALRTDTLKRKLVDPPPPLFKDMRELILRKCEPTKEKPIRAMFEKEPFGTLERLVTQKLLDVVKPVTKEELDDTNWLRLVARLAGRSSEQMRVMVLKFLETDIFNISVEHCVTFLDPLIESWDIDLATFGMEIVLNRRLAPGPLKKFAFVELTPAPPVDEEPGLQAFLQDPSLRGDATAEEIDFLRKLKFTRQRPTPLYYYRELQNLRDPLHFRHAKEEKRAQDCVRVIPPRRTRRKNPVQN